MKKLLLLLSLLFTVGLLQAQDTTDVRQIQLNLDKYYQQHRVGTGLFAFGVVLASATLIGLDRQEDLADVRNVLYGLAGGAATTGLLIQMEATKYLRDAAEIRLSPTSISLNF